MYYGEIKKTDVANGTGIRVTLFVSGCRVCCKECFNKETWDFKYGKEFTKETEDEIIEALKPSHIQGLSVLGGEPFEEENQECLTPFLEKVKETYPKKDIWCYTGYTYEKDLLHGRKHTAFTERMLNCIDTLVDGSFEENLKDITLKFRGSSNQRVIKIKQIDPVKS